MQIVKQTVTILSPVPYHKVLATIYNAARTCYGKAYDTQNSIAEMESFIHKRINDGHLSVIEHSSATVRIVCDRAIANELTRHRIASFSQESTRYVRYDNCAFIQPECKNEEALKLWEYAISQAEHTYKELLSQGVPPQYARSVLPLCLSTKLCMTANFREWRHIFELRCDNRAHPQMVRLMREILQEMYGLWPVFFQDLHAKYPTE